MWHRKKKSKSTTFEGVKTIDNIIYSKNEGTLTALGRNLVNHFVLMHDCCSIGSKQSTITCYMFLDHENKGIVNFPIIQCASYLQSFLFMLQIELHKIVKLK